MIEMEWTDLSLCASPEGKKFDWFDEPVVEMYNMCFACPVIEECNKHALQHEFYGFWAGKTEEQRAAERRNPNFKRQRGHR
jgi:Transcription factor WhiB